ncbi:MAG: DNA repair protein RecO [Candidatus Eremiobacteraeota bacterium]|nr:DNA repair protein RecO [Candidatus Eremiobacteraeota bacterium]
MTLPRAYKTSGIVLRARNLGEADRIFTLFTTDRGKINAVAKGVRRAKSHFAGRLEFMSEAALSIHRGRNLDIITSAEISASCWNAVVQPRAFAAASMIAELVDAFCEPDLALADVYALMIGATSALGTIDDPLALIPRFSVRLLDALGLAPHCESCVRCGKSLSGGSAWLDIDSGGLAGIECGASWRNVFELGPHDVANFQALAAPKIGGVRAALQATPTTAKAIEMLIAHHLGRRPKARAHAAEFIGC